MSEVVSVSEMFGKDVFNDAVMKDRLPKSVYKKLKKTIDLVIRLEMWDGTPGTYDRIGLDEEYIDILGNKVLCNTIPIRPGRNVAVIVNRQPSPTVRRKWVITLPLNFCRILVCKWTRKTRSRTGIISKNTHILF